MLWVLPICLLTLTGLFQVKAAVILGIAGVLILPIASYRFSKCLWTGLYYAILRSELEPMKGKEEQTQ